MKKNVMLVLGVLGAMLAQAQLSDTVEHRVRNYYYSRWFDTCQCEGIYRGTAERLASLNLIHHTSYQWGEFARRDYAAEPVELLGMAVMVIPEVNTRLYIDSNYGEEYVYVAYYDSVNNDMVKVDSARWDTVQPKTMKLVLTSTPEYYFWNDTYPGGVAYCRVYEAYFEKPVRVEGEFYVVGSFHGSELCEAPGWTEFCMHKPVYYATIGGPTHPECCYPTEWEFRRTHTWAWHDTPKRGLGPFLPIIEPQSLLEVRAADSAMGHVTGGGFYPDSSSVLIRAVPEYGYVFSHWDDGDTVNPRLVTVTSDTVFTAYFEEAEYYRMAVRAYPPEYGTVEGDGSYPQNTDTVIAAHAMDGQYRFVEWHDHDITNPRRVRVVQDTVFTAIFELVEDSGSHQGIGAVPPLGSQFRLVPNPASSEVRCVMGGEGFAGGVLTVADAAGREVLRRELKASERVCEFRVADLPAGTYFVTLATKEGTSTRKLVVE